MTDPELAPQLDVSPPLANMDPPVSTPPSPHDPIPPSFPLHATISLKPSVPDLSDHYLGTTHKAKSQQQGLKVADRLMRKAREAKIKFAARKKEIEANYMKEVKATPTINPTSRKIAEQNFLSRYFPDKMQLVLQQAKSAQPQASGDNQTPSFPSPKQETSAFLATVRRADLHTERQESVEREKRETFVMIPRCHVSLPLNASTKVYLPVRIGPDEGSKIVSPEYSLSAIATLRRQKSDAQVNDTRIVDPLDMNAEQRGKYFLEQKQRKLQAELEKKLAEEARLCTFTPSISHSPHLSESHSQLSVSVDQSGLTDRSRISQTSYTDRYQKKQEMMRQSAMEKPKKVKKEETFKEDITVRVPPPNTLYEAALPHAHPGPPREDSLAPFYTQLSPTAQRLCFRAGCDLEALQDRVAGKKK